jgi:hypothetical protein
MDAPRCRIPRQLIRGKFAQQTIIGARKEVVPIMNGPKHSILQWRDVRVLAICSANY